MMMMMTMMVMMEMLVVINHQNICNDNNLDNDDDDNDDFTLQCPHDGCEWAFTTAYKLKRHERGHTGERPFVVSHACHILQH